MEAARAANVYPQKILYMKKEGDHGVVSTGQLDRMGDFYCNVRGLGKAIAKEPCVGRTDLLRTLDQAERSLETEEQAKRQAGDKNDKQKRHR